MALMQSLYAHPYVIWYVVDAYVYFNCVPELIVNYGNIKKLISSYICRVKAFIALIHYLKE